MTGHGQNPTSFFGVNPRIGITLLVVALGGATMLVAPPAAQAQTFTVLHAFAGGADGATPAAGVTLDRGGRLYGSTSGYANGYGSIYKLTGSEYGWLLSPLYDFSSQIGLGTNPGSKLVFGPDGNLYGTTLAGGYRRCGGDGCGVVFKLRPPASNCRSSLCPWTEIVLYTFGGPPDGWRPSDIIFDNAGNLYGVTENGGGASCGGVGCGMVYELTPGNGGWTETILYNFQGGTDGEYPNGGLIFDAAGNLYGVTDYGGSGGGGTVFELSPSNGGWTETILHNFRGSDGEDPQGPLLADQAGNLYGVTGAGGSANLGAVFELAQPRNWTFELLYSFPNYVAGDQPEGGLVFDAAGNLYGTTLTGGPFNYGTAFELAPSNGGWVQTTLHGFRFPDGEYPNGGLTIDSSGNLYGTTVQGGQLSGACSLGCGTVWEITP